MVVKNRGAASLLKRQFCKGHDIRQYHCLVHQEPLCGKVMKFNHTMSGCLIMNFIHKRGLHYHKFQEYTQGLML